MWSYSLFATVLVLVGLWPMAAAPPDPAAPVRLEDLKDNVKARLVGTKRSEDRDQHLIAKFETLGADRKEILIGFPYPPTTHQQTLLAVIYGCLSRSATDVGVEAIFSLPKGWTGFGGDAMYDRCYLVSLKIGTKK